METILIIEDTEDIRENVAEILTLSGYNVITAENGKEGIAKAQSNDIDLIISDIMMPGIDGYGVLHVLHMDAKTQNTPFIFLTSKSERSDFRAAMELGADDYITKPFSGNELLQAVQSRLTKLSVLKKALSPDMEGVNELRQAIGNNKSLQEIADESNINTYRKKQIIYKEGQYPHFLYYIVSGKVKTFKTHEDGKDLVMDLYNTGDFLGYTTLLEGGPYRENAEAMEETEIATIPKKDFEHLINNSPATARKFISLLAKNVVEKETNLLGIAYNTLRKKVAGALVSLEQKYHEKKSEPFQIDISREDLATIAGTAPESLIRTLSDFKSEQLIDIKNGKVIISDAAKLRNLIR